METEKCPFEHPLIGETFGCSRAQSVSKHDGPHAVCTVATAAARCQRLFDAFNQAALPVFDVPDDLEKMPHSVPVKIQYGGLQGLSAQLYGSGDSIPDIHPINRICHGITRKNTDKFISFTRHRHHPQDGE